MVSVLASYSDDPRSNPAEAYSFFCKKIVFEKSKNNQKEAGVDPFLKKHSLISWMVTYIKLEIRQWFAYTFVPNGIRMFNSKKLFLVPLWYCLL